MGKKKQAQRTKNNVVPASSGRSAELLQSTKGLPFAGFSTLKDGGFIPIVTSISDELDVNINEDFRLVWKKMNKKDTTTKLKALDEFKKLCRDSDVEVLKPVLPYWPRLFYTLSTDEEHRVREATHAAHRALVSKAGRNIAPFLKQLVGPWFTGQHDTYPPAASTAESSFQETFPPNKLVEAIVFCQEEILNYISNNLLNQTAQSLANNQNISQEVKDARYQRVVISCLNGYALYLKRLPIEHLRKAEEANRNLVSSAKFWKFNKDPAPVVRAAWFTALVALCEKASFLLAEEAKHVCMAVFTNLDETDSVVVHNIWLAVLHTFNVVDDVWKYVSLEKLVLPKLWKVLREGADGNASLVFPNLLPLLSKIPLSLLQDKAQFYSKFFVNLRSGLKVRNVQISAKESSTVAISFLECLRYIISVNSDQEKLCLSLFEEQVFPLIEDVMSEPKLQLVRPSLFSGLACLINYWAKESSSLLFRNLTANFWSRFSERCNAALNNHIIDSVVLTSHCAALGTVLTTFKNPDSQPRKSFKVKFVSPRRSQDENTEEPSLTEEQSSLAFSFEEERTKFVNGQLSTCFRLIRNCSEQAKVVLVTYLEKILEEYDSVEVFRHILSVGQRSWKDLYKQEFRQWLRNDSIPLYHSLQIIFMLLKYVEDDNDLQMVYNDLSGFASSKNDKSQPEPLMTKWQDILQWALKPEHLTACVKEWILAHRGICRLASELSRHKPSYNILHNCLHSLSQNAWLTTDCLSELIKILRHNLTSSMVCDEVRACSADLLQIMLQNTSNHMTLALLPTEDLSILLYELFTAVLEKRKHFPLCWQYCLIVLSLKSDSDLMISAICETCVDLMVAVIRSRKVNLADSLQLVSILEELVVTAGAEETVGVVLDRLSARVREDEQLVWNAYIVAETVAGSLQHTWPCTETYPLSRVPLEEYVTSMIPFLMMVVRLQTATETDDSEGQFPYARLNSVLLADDLWDWSLQALQLLSLCISVEKYLSNTEKYFLLKEKIAFILKEVMPFREMDLKELVRHLDVSLLEEDVNSLKSDSLSTLQKKAVLQNLGYLFPNFKIEKDLELDESKSDILKCNFVPDDVLAHMADKIMNLQKEQLPVINACCRNVLELVTDYLEPPTINICILDRVFDQYVAEIKERRLLLQLSDEELHFIAEVAEFVCHSVEVNSAHMKQSSWDACMVATAALTNSVSSAVEEWMEQLAQSPPSGPKPYKTIPPPSSDPWPLCLMSERVHGEAIKENCLRLPLVRAMYSISRLFNAVSDHFSEVNHEDKAAVTRHMEWNEVFLPGAHSDIARAWKVLAGKDHEEPATVMLIEALSSSVSKYVEYPHFVDNHQTFDCLKSCCQLLRSYNVSVQVAAFRLFMKLIPAMLELDMQECEKDNVALSCQLVDNTMVETQDIIDIMLCSLRFGDTCIVEPYTDCYSVSSSYLLLWWALLKLCKEACSQLRALYTTWLKEEYLAVMMKTVFCLMPEAALHGEVASPRIAELFSKPPDLTHKGAWTSDRLAHLSCWVFACALGCLPAAMRQWWYETDHKIRPLVEHVTATYVSPALCAEEMQAIKSQGKEFDNMTVHVHPTAKEVYAVYTLEESRMELVIELAHNHPLSLVKVKSGQSMVSTTQTRQWLLQITIFLTHQNGSIWDALELWKTSLDKRFEGVEECYICFAILHSVSHQLPKLSCHTCHKKFHSHCLYKWFTTSNKSTCPICRNLF